MSINLKHFHRFMSFDKQSTVVLMLDKVAGEVGISPINWPVCACSTIGTLAAKTHTSNWLNKCQRRAENQKAN
jgi:hypothetical protein